MRYTRLLGLVLLVLLSLIVAPVAFGGARPSIHDNDAELRSVTLESADGCPPGPRPTMY